MDLKEISQTTAKLGSIKQEEGSPGEIGGLENPKKRLRLDILENRESLKIWGPMNCGTRVSKEDE